MKDKLKKLLDVKSIVTLVMVLTMIFVVIFTVVNNVTLTGEPFDTFKELLIMIITYFFGYQTAKSSTNTTADKDNKTDSGE